MNNFGVDLTDVLAETVTLQASDGIFLDYKWQIEHLEDTKSLFNSSRTGQLNNSTHPSTSSPTECTEAWDVYMGVDVFGRGTMGGGGFNCSLPLSCARAEGLSAALFAPGWVYEHGPVTEWRARHRQFWRSCADTCALLRRCVGIDSCTSSAALQTRVLCFRIYRSRSVMLVSMYGLLYVRPIAPGWVYKHCPVTEWRACYR